MLILLWREGGFYAILTSTNPSTERSVVSMTAVKEQFMQMLPQSLSEVPDDEVQYMINILVKWNKPDKKPAASVRRLRT